MLLLFCSQWVKAASGLGRDLTLEGLLLREGKLGGSSSPCFLPFRDVAQGSHLAQPHVVRQSTRWSLLIGCDKGPCREFAFHVICLSWFLRSKAHSYGNFTMSAGAGSHASRASSLFDTIEGGIHQCPTVHTVFQAQSYSQSSICEFKQLLLLNGRLVNLLYTPGPIAWCMHSCSPRADLKSPSERLTEQISPQEEPPIPQIILAQCLIIQLPVLISCIPAQMQNALIIIVVASTRRSSSNKNAKSIYPIRT
jgi:hypothetical protein